MYNKILTNLSVPSLSTVSGTSEEWSELFTEYAASSASFEEVDNAVQTNSATWSETPTISAVSYRDKKTGATQGGTFTSGSWQTRTLNEVSEVNGIGSTLSSNEVTLPAGTYLAQWSAPAFYTYGHQTRLYNVTDATVVGYGSTEFVDVAGTGYQTRSIGSAVFTLSSSKALRIEHECTLTRATNGFGVSRGTGTQIYAEITFIKLA